MSSENGWVHRAGWFLVQLEWGTNQVRSTCLMASGSTFIQDSKHRVCLLVSSKLSGTYCYWYLLVWLLTEKFCEVVVGLGTVKWCIASGWFTMPRLGTFHPAKPSHPAYTGEHTSDGKTYFDEKVSGPCLQSVDYPFRRGCKTLGRPDGGLLGIQALKWVWPLFAWIIGS